MLTMPGDYSHMEGWPESQMEESMEYIKESGTYTGTIISAKEKMFHDKAIGVLFNLAVGGKYLKFILMVKRSNGDLTYSHKGETHLLPGTQLLFDIADAVNVENSVLKVTDGFYKELKNQNITVYVESTRHMIKRHEFYTNEVKRVG